MNLSPLREKIRRSELADEMSILRDLVAQADITQAEKEAFSRHAVTMVETIRKDDEPGLMEAFLAEYGLSTSEGVALMCLAEALLRVLVGPVC